MGDKNSLTTKTPKGWYSRRHQTKESHDHSFIANNAHNINRGYDFKRTPPQPPYNTSSLQQ